MRPIHAKRSNTLSLLTAVMLLSTSCQSASTILPTTRSAAPTPSAQVPQVTATFKCEHLTPTSTRATPTPRPTSTSIPTLLPADVFPTGTLARALAGSPDCQLPCWLGLLPGRTQEEDLAQWLVSNELLVLAERSDFETGSTLLLRNANPGNTFAGPARLISIHLRSSRIAIIAVDGIPLAGPIQSELRSVIALLGAPQHILLEPSLGGQTLGYALRFVYPSRGLQISYFGFADQVVFTSEPEDAVCLGRSPYTKVTLDLSPSLADLAYTQWDWTRLFGVDEATLAHQILDSQECVPFP